MNVIASPLKIEILWTQQGAHGVALTVIDVLTTLCALAAMRAASAPAPLVWRWRVMAGQRVPKLPAALTNLAPQRFKGTADILVLPGWHAHSGPHLDQRVAQAANLAAYMREVHSLGGLIVGVGNAAALLGQAGLLKGRDAVAPWPFVSSVMRHSEGIHLRSDCAWTTCERLWTCNSPVWTTEIFLDALKQTHCAELAIAASHVLLHSAERQQVSAQIVQDSSTRKVPPGAVEQARRWLEDHLTEAYDLRQLAQAGATSQSTLLRHFAATHGQSPLQYLHGLRMARARVLLETTYLPVDQVALACGYVDVGTFRRLFQRTTNELPALYREHYRLRTQRPRWTGAA